MRELPRCTINAVTSPIPDVVCPKCMDFGFADCEATDPEAARVLSRHRVKKTYSARETLQMEGDDARAIGIIQSGLAAVVKHTQDGRRQIIGFLKEGDIFGISPKGAYFASVEAITPVEVCLFPKDLFEATIAAHPKLASRYVMIVSNELEEAANHQVILGRLSARERLAAFLCGLLDDASEDSLQDNGIHLAMTRNDIADYLGLSMEHVSRGFSQLAREGLITLPDPHHIKVRSATELHHLASD